MSWLDIYKSRITDAHTALERTIHSGGRVLLSAKLRRAADPGGGPL